MGKSIKFIALVCLIVCCMASISQAQLAFHTDTNTNSFTLKAPGVQQTFTRYFGGQQGGLLQAQATQQKQQVVPASYQPTQQALQSAYAALQQQQDQQLQSQAQAQAQYLSAQEYAAYLQQTQAAQAAQAQHQYQQTQFAAAGQQPQAAAPLSASPEALRQSSNLLGVAYSPSNQVSHVKFSSGGLAYNF